MSSILYIVFGQKRGWKAGLFFQTARQRLGLRWPSTAFQPHISIVLKPIWPFQLTLAQFAVTLEKAVKAL